MNKWKKHFADKVGQLRSHWEESFGVFANETLQSVFDEFADFVTGYHFHASALQRQPGMRAFKFALGEDVFVLVKFKPARMGEIVMESEFFVPSKGRTDGEPRFVFADSAGQEWAEECFQQSLDELLLQIADGSGVSQKNLEPVMA